MLESGLPLVNQMQFNALAGTSKITLAQFQDLMLTFGENYLPLVFS
jgi:hypothetical protein